MSVANRDRHHQVVGAMPSSWWCLSLCWTFFFLDHQPKRQDMKFKKEKRKGRANENVAVKSKWLSVNVKNNNKEKYYIFFF
jgi:hypothetical protein